MNITTHLLRASICAGFALFVSEAQAQTTWTGATSTDYAEPSNWNTLAVPTASDDVLIPGGTPNQPLIANGVLGRGRNITINSTATLTLAGSGTLRFNGNIIDNGALGGVGGDGVIEANGAAAGQTISGSGTGIGNPAINVTDLMVRNTGGFALTLSHSMRINRQLGLTSANLNTDATNVLTLVSTPTVTAFILNTPLSPAAPNGPTYVVNGPVTAQRAINGSLNPATPTNPNRLGYRHYSSPVANSTIADLTVAGAPPTGFTPEISAGVTYNTNPNPRATVPFPTVYDYDQARVMNTGINYFNGTSNIDRGFKVPLLGQGSATPGAAELGGTASLNAPLEVGRGYAVNISSTALVDFVGQPNNGTITRTVYRNAVGTPDYAASGWQLLGNPYPAGLDFSALAPPPGPGSNLVNVDAVIYVVQSTAQYGNTYRAYSSSTNSINPTIPLGQGFFIHVTDGQTMGSVTFNNNQRLTDSDNTPFQRTNAITHPQLNLSLRSVATPDMQDEAVVFFENNTTAGIDAYDGHKLYNSTGLNVSTLAASGQPLAIDGRPMTGGQVTVPVQVYIPATGTYTLQAASLLNMNGMYTYLRDIQLGTLTDLAQQPSYTFSMNAANTTPRFELVFSARVLATAPAALTQQVSVYPNPAHTMVSVELPASLGRQSLTATLMDAMGRNVRTTTLPAQGTAAHNISLSGLAAGIYSLQMRTDAGLVVKRLVIE